jgi:hypothetical protein
MRDAIELASASKESYVYVDKDILHKSKEERSQ